MPTPLYGGADTEARRLALESRLTAKRVLDMFDDDGDGLLVDGDLALLETTMTDADDIVTGILFKKGYTLEQLELMKEDRQIVRAWAYIAAQLAGQRKPEWKDAQGFGPFHAEGQMSRKDLEALARGDTRSVKEPEAGPNPALVALGECRPLQVAPDPRDPYDRGPGGF